LTLASFIGQQYILMDNLGLLDIPASDSDYDPEQAEWLRQHKTKKKKSRGHSL
jgi:hypothetical protein